jgi:hypothetical protein
MREKRWVATYSFEGGRERERQRETERERETHREREREREREKENALHLYFPNVILISAVWINEVFTYYLMSINVK